MSWTRPALTGLVLAGVIAGCAGSTPQDAAPRSVGPVVAPSRSTSPKPRPVVSAVPLPTAVPSPASAGSSLVGDTGNSWAFAPLANPSAVVVEGSVPSSKAYSTSKVLIVAAFIQTVAGGDPGRLTAGARELIRRSLTASDGNAVLQLQNAIPGGIAAAGGAILRSIGDSTTSVPSSRLGGMQWTVREQVRFMAALGGGRVVSAAASAYILESMHPIEPQRWGLGTIGASSIKGGWLRADTETRQMGIYGDYAVAVITAHVGPAVLQTDGDSAHVAQMNALAARLKARLS